MSLRFRDVFTKADWAKMTVLLAVSAVAWFFVWREYQKPLVAFDLESQVTAHPAGAARDLQDF